MKQSTFTSKQAYMLFLLASLSPAMLTLPVLGSRLGGAAGWVSVLLACGVYCGLVAMLHRFFASPAQADGLWGVYRDVLGKPLGTVLCAAYALWIFILTGLHLRIFAERFATSVLPGIPHEFFMIVALALFYVILGGEFRHFMGMVSICFYAVVISCGLIFLARLPDIRPKNLLPVTTLDLFPVLKGMYPALGVFCYITFMMFSADEISDRPSLKREGLKSALYLLGLGWTIFFVTAGIFGPSLTQELTLPFFISVKAISLFGSLERLESVFTIVWIISDMAVLIMLFHGLLGLIGRLAGLRDNKNLISPVLLGSFVLAMYIVSNIFEVVDFSAGYGLAADITLGLGVPALVFAVGKLRRRI